MRVDRLPKCFWGGGETDKRESEKREKVSEKERGEKKGEGQREKREEEMH